MGDVSSAAAAVRLRQRWGFAETHRAHTHGESGAALEWTSRNHRKGRFPKMLHEGADRPPFDLGLTAWEPGNISWLVAHAFIWGSVMWVVNGFFVWAPPKPNEAQLLAAAWTGFAGGTLFECGAALAVLEALNSDHPWDFGPALEAKVEAEQAAVTGHTPQAQHHRDAAAPSGDQQRTDRAAAAAAGPRNTPNGGKGDASTAGATTAAGGRREHEAEGDNDGPASGDDGPGDDKVTCAGEGRHDDSDSGAHGSASGDDDSDDTVAGARTQAAGGANVSRASPRPSAGALAATRRQPQESSRDTGRTGGAAAGTGTGTVVGGYRLSNVPLGSRSDPFPWASIMTPFRQLQGRGRGSQPEASGPAAEPDTAAGGSTVTAHEGASAPDRTPAAGSEAQAGARARPQLADEAHSATIGGTRPAASPPPSEPQRQARPRPAPPAPSHKRFRWRPSLRDWHSLGFLAAAVQLFAATTFWISTFAALPHLVDDPSQTAERDALFWAPQVVGGCGFIASSRILLYEVQPAGTLLPPIGSLGWHAAFFNGIGALGFTLSGAFGFTENSTSCSGCARWGTAFSTFWGGWAFLVGSYAMLLEAVNKHPREAFWKHPAQASATDSEARASGDDAAGTA